MHSLCGLLSFQWNSSCLAFVDLVRRHAGVLGLSACILSSPYDVPTWMPQLLMDLSAHLNDTQPIEVCAFGNLMIFIVMSSKKKP